LGFIAILYLHRRRTGNVLLLSIIVGLSVFMPILDVGRQTDDLLDIGRNASLRLPDAYLRTGHFDAYANTLYAIKYVEAEGITWGRQFLGPIFFWVPRAVWVDKPVGTGYFVASYYEFPYTNISMPLQGEAFVNFGLAGVAIFGLFFGSILRIIDSVYHYRGRTKENASIQFIEVLYPFWLGLVFFISRGDLMSSFAYTVGFTAAGFPLLIMRGRRNRQISPPSQLTRRVPSFVEARK